MTCSCAFLRSRLQYFLTQGKPIKPGNQSWILLILPLCLDPTSSSPPVMDLVQYLTVNCSTQLHCGTLKLTPSVCLCFSTSYPVFFSLSSHCLFLWVIITLLAQDQLFFNFHTCGRTYNIYLTVSDPFCLI